MCKALKSLFLLFVKACVSYLQLLELKQNLKRTCLEQCFRCATQIHILRIWKTSIADCDLNKILHGNLHLMSFTKPVFGWCSNEKVSWKYEKSHQNSHAEIKLKFLPFCPQNFSHDFGAFFFFRRIQTGFCYLFVVTNCIVFFAVNSFFITSSTSCYSGFFSFFPF